MSISQLYNPSTVISVGIAAFNEVETVNMSRSCTISTSKRSAILTYASFAVIFSMFRLLIEFFQYVRLREAYFKDAINWLELIVYFSAMNFVWVFHSPCYCVQRYQWEAGVISVFLGWIVFTLNCDKLAFIGLYIVMFVAIFKTFLKAILLSVLLIIAFGLSFFMLFGEDSTLFVSYQAKLVMSQYSYISA